MPRAPRAFFRHALSRDPDFTEAELNLAIALAALGEREEAEAILDKLSKPPRLNFWGDRDPVRASAVAIRGLIAAHEGRLVEAAGHMRRAVAMGLTCRHSISFSRMRSRISDC